MHKDLNAGLLPKADALILNCRTRKSQHNSICQSNIKNENSWFKTKHSSICTGSRQSPSPSVLPPLSQIQYLCTAEGQGGGWDKATSTKLCYSWVSHWMIWSICQPPVRSANGKKLTWCPVYLLGLLMKIPPPHLQLFLPSSAALCLSPKTSAVCLCKTNHAGQISPVLWVVFQWPGAVERWFSPMFYGG